MAAIIPGFIVRPVKEIRNLVCSRLEHEFSEGLLKAQTALRITKVCCLPIYFANGAAD
jgi:hypothetical protein